MAEELNQPRFRNRAARLGQVILNLVVNVAHTSYAPRRDGPAGVVTREELERWCETGEFPACVAEPSSSAGTTVRASTARASARARKQRAR